MLVFGGIKEHEKPLIKTAFNAIPGKNKVLLAPGWKIPRRKINYIRLREWVWNFEVWRAKQNNKFRTNLGFIKEEDAHYYLNAQIFSSSLEPVSLILVILPLAVLLDWLW